MDKRIKIVVGVVAGVAACYAAYRIGKKYMANKKPEIISDEWDDLVEDKDDFLDPDVFFDATGTIFDAREEGKKFIENLQAKKDELTETLFHKPPSEEDTGYVDYAKKYKGEEDEPVEKEQNVFDMAPPEEIEQIFFISEDEYEKDHLGSDEIWGKVVLNYYVPDDVLTDDEDNIINESDVIGAGMIKEYLNHGNGENAFFVRNNNFDTDFKIMMINESVLGDLRE